MNDTIYSLFLGREIMGMEDILEYWGKSNLKRWSLEGVQNLHLRQSSKVFMTEVGFPCNEDWTLRFDSETSELPRIGQRGNFVCIGFDNDVPICVDENDGSVVAVNPQDGTTRLINSSVEDFGEFLMLYQEYRKGARITPEPEIFQVIAMTEEEMRKRDPRAFENLNNWWPVIIEQMNHGLL